jgi:hypothetical protein
MSTPCPAAFGWRVFRQVDMLESSPFTPSNVATTTLPRTCTSFSQPLST